MGCWCSSEPSDGRFNDDMAPVSVDMGGAGGGGESGRRNRRGATARLGQHRLPPRKFNGGGLGTCVEESPVDRPLICLSGNRVIPVLRQNTHVCGSSRRPPSDRRPSDPALTPHHTGLARSSSGAPTPATPGRAVCLFTVEWICAKTCVGDCSRVFGINSRNFELS